MESEMKQDLKKLSKELTEEWISLHKNYTSHELYSEFEEKDRIRDPYTLLVKKVGYFSGITAVQKKIEELIEKYEK